MPALFRRTSGARRRGAFTLAVLSVLLGACGAQAVPSRSIEIDASPLKAPSQAPAAASSPPAPTVAGPTSYADWVERQGFGGSSGLNNVNKLVQRLRDHPTDETAWEAADESSDIAALIAWLDAHPATSCWADYHVSVRASLAAIVEGYAKVGAALGAGGIVPSDVAASMAAESQKAKDVPDPADCP